MLGRRQRAVVWTSFLIGFGVVAAPRLPAPMQPGSGSRDIRGNPVAALPVDISNWDLSSPFAAAVAAAALRNGLDPALVLAVVEVESGSDPKAVSAKGAVGLMQVLPETAALVGISSPADPARNLEAGCRYLASLLASFGGDVELALAAYNAGPGAVRRWGTVPPYRETRGFVLKVAAAYQRITGLDVQFASRFVSDASAFL